MCLTAGAVRTGQGLLLVYRDHLPLSSLFICMESVFTSAIHRGTAPPMVLLAGVYHLSSLSVNLHAREPPIA
jgi:hypothetical protein